MGFDRSDSTFRRWPWILAVLVVALPGVAVAATLGEREREALRVAHEAASIEEATVTGVGVILAAQATLAPEEFRRAYPGLMRRLTRAPARHAATLEREVGGRDVRRMRLFIARLRTETQIPARWSAADRAIFAAGAGRLAAFSRRISDQQHRRAEAIARQARWGQIAALVLTVLLVVALVQQARRRLAAESARHAAGLRRLADHDALTGLRNRRRLDADRHALPAGPLGVMVLDLDGFKAYNDRAGHAAGDRLLQDAARALTGVLAGRGHAYRLGGDEFCVLVPGDALPAAAVARAVDAATGDRGVTVSVGAATLPGEAPAFTDALRLADQRMYAMKAGASARAAA